MSFHNSESIRRAMYEELQNILSPDTHVRTSAEERLSQLKFTEGYGVYLAEFTMNASFELGLRQLAAVMLKKYVESSWSANDESQTCEQAKKMIKSILPNGLCDPNSKIRTSVAYTVSTIASHDWPNNWLELFDIIVKCLGGNEDSVHGAMQVLVEFTYDLSNQITNVGPLIISEVFRIFSSEGVYSLKTRASAVDIFKQILKSIMMHVATREEQVAILTPAVMDPFIQRMLFALGDPQSDCLVKTSVLKCFRFMLNFMPKWIRPHMVTILSPVWQLMAQTAEIYVRVVVNETIESPFPDNDDDDELENLTTMILQLFEFVHSVIDCGKFKGLLRNVLGDLIYVVIVYMQITEKQGEEWALNPEKFVQDEEEQSVEYSVRVSAQDLLTAIGQSVDNAAPALQDALSRHYALAEQQKATNPHWWKVHEACMLAVSALEFVIEGKSATADKFNLSEYLTACKTLLTTSNASPFLTGRCLCLLSLLSSSDVYNEPLLTELLGISCAYLADDKPIVVRICAVRAVQYFCENFKGGAKAERKALVLSKLGVMFEGVFGMVGVGKYDTLNLLLETIHAIISFNEEFTGSAQVQNKAIPLTIAIFLKYHEDRYTLELVLELLKILSQNPYCIGPLQERIIPTLVSILNLNPDKEQSPNTTMQDCALDVLTTIVRNCKAPLSDPLMESAFPAAVQCILRTDDQAVMQSGGKCVRAFIHVAPDQVCGGTGDGLNKVMLITQMLLNPMLNTDAPSVGEMIITLIARAEKYLSADTIHVLLKSVISKLQTVKLEFTMNLLMIFAQLFLTQLDALLSFLGTVPGPNGEPAISYIFTNWLSNHGSFYGVYCRKVSLMSLCKVFEYGITSKDTRLTSATIRMVVSQNSNAKTRSQYSNAQQVVNVPILVRINQILIAEVAHLNEMNQAQLEEEEEVSSDEEESGAASGEDPKLEPFHGIDSEEEDEEDGDPMLKDLLNDPVMQSDFDLIKFMQNFSRDEAFKDFPLNQTEKDILRSIQVNV